MLVMVWPESANLRSRMAQTYPLTLCAPSEQAATGSSIRHQTLVSFRLPPPSVPILPNVLELLPHEFSHVLQGGDPCVQDCRFSLSHAGCVAVHFAVLAHCGERKHAMEFSSVDLELASVVAFERDATGLAGSPDGGLRDGAQRWILKRAPTLRGPNGLLSGVSLGSMKPTSRARPIESWCDCPPGPNLRLAALLERTPGLSSNISRCSHRAA
jgi:hypothetical protein